MDRAPVVTGIGRVGETITCDYVRQGPVYREIIFRWWGNGNLIAGENGTTYKGRQSDVGGAVSCDVILVELDTSIGGFPLIIFNEPGALPNGQAYSVTRK